jgi:carbon-monoxide dehydrogenase medium subunit
MGLPRFNYHVPTSSAEACRMLSALRGEAALLAGGTDLLVQMKNRERCPGNIVSLLEIEEMKRFDFSGADKSIGACCTISRIAESSEIRSIFPALASAAGHIGSPAVRNLGTIGGNAVTASPAADLPPALIAYGAKVRLRREDHERVLPLDRFFLGPGSTHIGEDEVLVDFILESPPEDSSAEFFKIGHRRALQCSVINGACYIALNSHDGTIEDARVVLGAVGPTVVRAVSSEKILIGEKPGSELFLEAGNAAARDCNPIDDLRASADYRHDMIRVLTSRTLHRALAKKTQEELV